MSGEAPVPPVKVRIVANVDGEVAAYLEERWRERVAEASQKGGHIPSFSGFIAEILTEWVKRERLRSK